MKNNFLKQKKKGMILCPFLSFKLKKNTPYMLVSISIINKINFNSKIISHTLRSGASDSILNSGLRKVVSNSPLKVSK